VRFNRKKQAEKPSEGDTAPGNGKKKVSMTEKNRDFQENSKEVESSMWE
jgi:hypothetical protein